MNKEHNAEKASPKGNRQPVFQAPIHTPDGEFVARYSEQGLCGLGFPHGRKGSYSKPDLPPVIRQWHELATAAVIQTLKGEAPTALPPLDLSCGTAFQRSVWEKMAKIELGKTVSYSEIAAAIGRPNALRAVGGACGANPIPVLVPCHRVVAANQRLGGFSGGLHWKRLLLSREGRSI